MERLDLIVVGGGAAALFALLQAASQAPAWRLTQIARRIDFGPAYATSLDLHLLNVPAARMGARPDAVDGFEQWLGSRSASAAGSAFQPRARYRQYLQDLQRTLPARLHVAEALAARLSSAGTWQVECRGESGRTTVEAARLVVATGPVPRASLAPAEPRLVEAWSWWNALEPQWNAPDSWRRVALLGSGLTAMDLVVGLRARGFRGDIDVYSRSARWSEAHAATTPLEPEASRALIGSLAASRSVRSAVRTLRQAARHHPWRSVLDALRPHTNELWQGWSPAERRRLLRHAFGAWNRHRHRAPPETAAAVRSDPRVHLHIGRVRPDEAGRLPLDADLIIDCTGLGLAGRAPPTPLLSSLARAGHLRHDETGIGWQVAGPATLALMGALRFGAEFECTAVPELRQQAAGVIAAWREAEERAAAL